MQKTVCGLRETCPALHISRHFLRLAPSGHWFKSGRPAANRFITVPQSEKGKTANYNGNGSSDEGAGGLKGGWRARFVTDDESAEKEERMESAPEDPYLVELNREKFWGRIAVISLGAVLLSERLSGRGIVTALNMATGVPVWEIEPALGLLVGGFLAGGIYPIVRRLGARVDAARQADAESSSKSNGSTAPAAEPTRKWGDSFQVATGRLAFITLAGTVLAEATTGKGILALLNVETGVEISEIEAGLTFLLLLLFTEDLKAPKE